LASLTTILKFFLKTNRVCRKFKYTWRR
jgi:hypothetical protein